MQDDAVLAERDGVQKVQLVLIGVRQQRAGLIGVAGQYDVIKIPGRPVREVDRHAAGRAAHAFDAGIGDNAALQRPGDTVYIIARTAGHGPPLRPFKIGQAVGGEKFQKSLGFLFLHLIGAGRPDGARHGQQEPVLKGFSVSALVQVIAQTDAPGASPGQVALGGQAEPDHVGDHAQMGGTEHVAFLRGEPQQIGAPFDAPGFRIAEAHLGGLRFDIQMVEQGRQIGVLAWRKNDKADIHRDRLAVIVDIYRATVSAQPVALFKQRDISGFPQRPCRAQPGDAGTDHGNFLFGARLAARGKIYNRHYGAN